MSVDRLRAHVADRGLLPLAVQALAAQPVERAVARGTAKVALQIAMHLELRAPAPDSEKHVLHEVRRDLRRVDDARHEAGQRLEVPFEQQVVIDGRLAIGDRWLNIGDRRLTARHQAIPPSLSTTLGRTNGIMLRSRAPTCSSS